MLFYVNLKFVNFDEDMNLVKVCEMMEVVLCILIVVVGVVMFDVCFVGFVGMIFVGGVIVVWNVIYLGMYFIDICCLLMLSDFGDVDFKVVLDVVILIIYFGLGGWL